MKKHIVLTVLGLLLGLGVLAWLQPNTSAGATVVIILAVAIVNAVGSLAGLVPARRSKRSTRS